MFDVLNIARRAAYRISLVKVYSRPPKTARPNRGDLDPTERILEEAGTDQYLDTSSVHERILNCIKVLIGVLKSMLSVRAYFIISK